MIKYLTFHTNKGKYGPCGQESRTYFETEEEGNIVGFSGSSGTLMDSIGVYMLKPRFSDDEASEYGEKNGIVVQTSYLLPGSFKLLTKRNCK